MENGLQKKYGLITAICMVVGIVVGSGVFFKAQTILQKTEGNMVMGIWAWLIGGAIMLCCIWAFSIMATRSLASISSRKTERSDFSVEFQPIRPRSTDTL